MVNQLISKQSLSAAIIATIIDQLYHTYSGYSHQFLHLFDSILSAETAYYIGFKFLFVFMVTFVVLKNVRGSIIKLSLIISITSAFLFSIVLTYMFPNMYGIVMHTFHAEAIFIAVFITLKYKLG